MADARTPTAPTGQPVTARLTYPEANPLAAALVSRLAQKRGIRALVIKGLSLEHHGLRTGHISADVDVLVEAGRLDELVAAITATGWELRPTSTGDRLMTHHSVTLLNPAWPNDLDVHSTFPGMLAGPETCFEALWEHRVPTVLGGCPAWIPDRPSTMVIWALHSLRGSARQSRHASELAELVAVVPSLTDSERAQLADRIVELGADRPLLEVPVLAQLVGDRQGLVADGAWDDWQGKVAQAHEASPWLQVLRETRPRDFPRVLCRAVWPTSHDLKLLDHTTVDTPLGRVRARGRRIGRLFRRMFG